MMQFSINGAPPKPLKGAEFTTPKFAAQMGQVRGRIGRMPFVMASAPGMERIGNQDLGTPGNVLIHFDTQDASSHFIDQYGRSLTNSGATLDASAPKFGAACALVELSGQAAQFIMLTQDLLDTSWTIECWVKPTSTNLGWLLWQAATQEAILGETTGTLDIVGASGFVLGTLSFGSYTTNVWTHRAIVRNGTTIKTYKDGVAQDSLTVSLGDALYRPTSGAINAIVGVNFTGYIDEFRYTNGTAIYTANFTPPTGPFPNP